MQLAIVAAGFTPGEADQLRRSMAAWKRRGGLEHFRERMLGGMAERGYATEFAEQVFEQIKGFGSYGFPGIACGQLRADRLRQLLAQVPRAGGLHLRAAQLAADGFLLAATNWCRTRAGMASRCARWTCATATGIARWSHGRAARDKQPAIRLGTAPDRRLPRRHRRTHCRCARSRRAYRRCRRPVRPGRTRRPASSLARRRRRAARPGRPSPPRALGRGRRGETVAAVRRQQRARRSGLAAGAQRRRRHPCRLRQRRAYPGPASAVAAAQATAARNVAAARATCCRWRTARQCAWPAW